MWPVNSARRVFCSFTATCKRVRRVQRTGIYIAYCAGRGGRLWSSVPPSRRRRSSSQVFDAVEQLNSVEDIATPVSAWGHFKRTRLKTRRVKTGAPVAVPVPVAVVSVKAERVIQDIVRERCVALDAPGGVRLTQQRSLTLKYSECVASAGPPLSIAERRVHAPPLPSPPWQR